MADGAGARARAPLAETTNRVNSPMPASENQASKARIDPVDASQTSAARHATKTDARAVQIQNVTANTPVATALNPPPPIEEAKRLSQGSYASTSSSRSKKNYKTHIGPWQLGRTLGKGSSARVRLCRHSVTNQLAAVKIVNRRMAYLVHDSSLAALSKWDSSLPEEINGEMRVPMAIEREVAILKLIEHPNIMKLYDIWENRSEIYLILEYIDQGDLFTFINSKGRLSEEVAIYFFRQMISAISYCHSFNVCHRDLKPENILITADLQIKIADFGMAALHQTANHQLATACGSPHYAAPELLKNRQYRGDRADIWSLGVILYAMLSATLPFDDPDLRVMMAKTKKGHYEMPKCLTPEAEDLIRRMLQVNPDRRISLKDIWKHPVVQKYSYLDDFGDSNGQLPDTRKGFKYTPVPPQTIDPQLLRQLRSMWHMFSEQDLASKLSSDEANDQKAFYWLLYGYRDKQLEDFKPELAHSMSDYHHLKPAIWKKRVSTCQFAQPRANGHGRSVSRFTVISTAADNDTETEKSYDPYRSSRMLQRCDSEVSHAKITIHRDSQGAIGVAQTVDKRNSTQSRRGRTSARSSVTVRQSSRGSLASLRSGRQGTTQVASAAGRHKRGVNFSHIRKRSTSAGPASKTAQARSASNTALGTTTSQRPASARPVTPNMAKLADGTHPKAKRASAPRPATKGGVSMIFNEELRRFSNNCAQDCDKAFGGSLIEDDSVGGSWTDTERKRRGSTPLSTGLDSPTVTTPATEASGHSWQSRPLPKVPLQNSSKNCLVTTSYVSDSGLASLNERGDGVEFSDEEVARLAIPVVLSKQGDRRVLSAPAYAQGSRKLSMLPSINENAGMQAGTNDGPRIVSAPPHSSRQSGHDKDYTMEYLQRVQNSIRVVHAPGAASPVKAPRPLNLSKKGSAENTGRSASQGSGNDDQVADTSSHGSSEHVKKKKSFWFRRSAKPEVGSQDADQQSVEATPSNQPQQPDGEAELETAKKKGFSFPFWRSNKNRDTKMMIQENEDVDEQAQAHKQAPKQVRDRKRQSMLMESGSGSTRNIEVKQNWLTRLFRVKPATSYICMTLSRKRARQEIVILLREWRRYGLRGIEVDKQRNIVFARLGTKNYLNLKEVEFAAEIMTVIEHGKRQPLSIVRFTQERGAASSFHRVVETMRLMFDSRHLVVTDKAKRKMMIKTLNA
ncbi:hypothetical protein HIM_05916 [Hirsutella minnesotensis 3608]|uniref:non-specific serine/threonine protein kinase n=1 Tax=Hirsutella minnesotensis 3608 TaxID=1043627 RepID=A0A0F8A567_9HYPO|nr:hypothetical protein HIM_05916 [Hirsutella minnesotensis 3608]